MIEPPKAIKKDAKKRRYLLGHYIIKLLSPSFR